MDIQQKPHDDIIPEKISLQRPRENRKISLHVEEVKIPRPAVVTNKKKKRHKKRCNFEGCRKKLAITALECKCAKKFCSRHLQPETHSCTYDFVKRAKDQLVINGGLGGGSTDKIRDRL